MIAALSGLMALGFAHTLAPGGAPELLMFAAVYGGYFGAGLSVIFLAVLGLTLEDSLTRLNALKQCLSLSANIAAAALLATSPQIVWPAVLVMALGAIAGGAIGGRLASLVAPQTLRLIVITIGVGVAIIFLVRG